MIDYENDFLKQLCVTKNLINNMDCCLNDDIDFLCCTHSLEKLESLWYKESWKVSKSFYDSIKHLVHYKQDGYKEQHNQEKKKNCCYSIMCFTKYWEIGMS